METAEVAPCGLLRVGGTLYEHNPTRLHPGGPVPE